jgi:hypothetical protein
MTMAEENTQLGHVFRPGPFRTQQAWWLKGHSLHWRTGSMAGRIPLSDVAMMRLHLPQGGASVSATCELVETSGRRHRISDRYWFRWTPQERHRFGRHERREASFRALTFTLARRLARANPQARLLFGPSRSEWMANAVVAAFALAMILGGAGLMIAEQRLSWPALAFMGLCAVSLPTLWPVLRSGGPAPLDPGTLHDPSGSVSDRGST